MTLTQAVGQDLGASQVRRVPKRRRRHGSLSGCVLVLLTISATVGCGSSRAEPVIATGSAATQTTPATPASDARYFDRSLPTAPGSELSFPDEFRTIEGITAASDAVFIGQVVGQRRSVLTQTRSGDESNPDGSTERIEWDGVTFAVSQAIAGSVGDEVVIPAFPVAVTDDGTVSKVEDPLADYLSAEITSSPDQRYLVFATEIDGGYRFTSFGAVAPIDAASNSVGQGLFSGPFAETSSVDRNLGSVTAAITAASSG